jgi:hypothetical protein
MLLPKGPGLRKTQGLPLVERRETLLVRTHDAAWRLVFEAADAVSEGQLRGDTWFGSTSLLLRAEDSVPASLPAIAARCIHIRLRAIRFARREAQARAPGSLAQSRCDVRFSAHPGGIRIDVDIEADLLAKGDVDASRIR